jgi:PKD repeat protein
MMAWMRGRPRTTHKVGAALAVILMLAACGLDEVSIPDFDGPAETGISLALTATPDLLPADGKSTAIVTARLRNPEGAGVAGRQVFFTITDSEGRFADIGDFPTSNGPGTGVSVGTDSSGAASVTYRSPARTDATANQRVFIAARIVGTDATGATYRTVAIELRSVEPRLFPQDPANEPPVCQFVMETPSGVGAQVLVQSTSFDTDGTIVRYFWDFGNGRTAVTPDANAVYFSPGSYTITHQVTDDDGAFDICTQGVIVR